MESNLLLLRHPLTLYGSYCLHSKHSGTNPKANTNFSPDSVELCRSVLGWEIERKVTKTGKFIKGLRLRTDGDGNYPTYDYQLMQRVTGACGSGDGLGDWSRCPQNKGFGSCDGSTQTFNENRESELGGEVKLKFSERLEVQSSPSSNPLVEGTSDPSPSSVTLPVTAKSPTQPQQSPAPTPRHKPPVFRVGDHCRYCGPEGAMAVTCRGKELKVLNTRINDQGEQDAKVKAPPWCTSYWVLTQHLKLK